PSSTETETFGALARRARALSIMAGETSDAVTWPVGPTAARAPPAGRPRPVAMSRKPIPRATPAPRHRDGQKDLGTGAQAPSYSAAASVRKESSSAIRTSPFAVVSNIAV